MSKPKIMAMNVCVAPTSAADKSIRARTMMLSDIAPGIQPSPDHDLIFNGGRTIANLNFFNFYVGGAESWRVSDMQSIDTALSAAMSDRNLNNVIVQYFPSNQITSNFLGSRVLPGPAPTVVSQGDVEAMVGGMSDSGALDGFDLSSTVFNFMLPSGTILNTDPNPGARLPPGCSGCLPAKLGDRQTPGRARQIQRKLAAGYRGEL